jgi:hypothetical protein
MKPARGRELEQNGGLAPSAMGRPIALDRGLDH